MIDHDLIGRIREVRRQRLRQLENAFRASKRVLDEAATQKKTTALTIARQRNEAAEVEEASIKAPSGRTVTPAEVFEARGRSGRLWREIAASKNAAREAVEAELKLSLALELAQSEVEICNKAMIKLGSLFEEARRRDRRRDVMLLEAEEDFAQQRSVPWLRP